MKNICMYILYYIHIFTSWIFLSFLVELAESKGSNVIINSRTEKTEPNTNFYETLSSKNLSFRKKPLLSLPVTPGTKTVI